MTVEFVRPWGRYSQGQRLVDSPYVGMVEELLRRGFVVKVEEEEQKPRRKQKVS